MDESDRQSIILDTSHRNNLTPPGTPGGDFTPLGSEHFDSDFSGDDNLTVFTTGMSEEFGNVDIGISSNAESSTIPTGNQGITFGRVNQGEQTSTVDLNVNAPGISHENPPAPPLGFRMLSGGIMYPLPNTSNPESISAVIPPSNDQSIPTVTKTVRGFDTMDLAMNSS